MGIIVKKLSLACLCLALAGWLGCSSSNQANDTASVQQAVEKHLARRTDLGNLQVTVDKVSFEGDHANAAVTIMARQDPKAKMQMSYRLRKTGTGWEVEPPQGSEAGAHGGSAAMPPAEGAGADLPPGHPSVEGGAGTEANELPPGHPPVKGGGGGDANALPPGHPPVQQAR
jgi:hypothetical protein